MWRPRRRSRTPEARSKAYLYVSDDKVDMLIDGLPPSLLERFDLKAKAGFPGLSVEVGSRQLQGGRFSRAEKLCAALEADGRVGDLHEEDSEFFRGTMLATWGFWSRELDGYADVAFFSGYPDEATFVGLGGSAYHTMERAGERAQQYSNSGIQTLMAFLKEQSKASNPEIGHRWQPPGAWHAEGREADHDNAFVPESVEYVAQRLLDDRDPDLRSIIGSPIYVARTGQVTTRRALEEYEALRDQYAVANYGKLRLTPGRNGRWQVGRLTPTQPLPWGDAEKGELRTDRG